MRLLIFLLFPALLNAQVTATKFFIEGKYPGVLYKPSAFDGNKKYPLVFFLHGDGEKGDGTDGSLTQKIIQSQNQANLLINAEKYGFIVVAPQLVSSLQGWQPGWTQGYIRKYFEYALKTFNVDTNYFHVTGLSRGGGGVWVAICDPVWSKKIASALPICGTGEYANDFLQPAINSVAVWAHHAKNDVTVGLVHSENIIRYINEKSPKIPARLTVYETGGHYIWGSVYANDSVYKWMLNYKKGSAIIPPVPPPPIPPGKKIKYRIIVYDDGSIETIPEGTTSTPVPTGRQLLAIRPAHVFDGTQARKTPEALFDGDTTTVALGDYYHGYILDATGGQIVWVVLDSFIDNTKFELFNGRWAYGSQVDFQLYYDIRDTSRKSPVYSTTLPSLEWKSLEANWSDSARLIKIRITDGGSNNFAEVKVFGNKLAPAPSILPSLLPAPPDEGKYFMGYNKLPTDTLMDDAGYSQRAIVDMDYVHPNANETDGTDIYFNRYGNSVEATYRPALRNGRKMYPALAAVRFGFKYPPNYTNDSKDMPRGADSTKPEAWEPVKTTYFGLAQLLGHNKSTGTSKYNYRNTPAGTGHGVVEEIEVGNEDDARWAGPLRFHSALVKLMKLRAAYEGIKAADPSLKVISGAITGIDTNYLKAMYITRLFAGLQRDPYNVIAVNEYATNRGGQHSGNSDGISPEDFNLFEKLQALIRVRDRYFPGMPVYLTEYGYDVHDGSNYEVPAITGQTKEQTKAFWVLRAMEEAAAAGISKFFQYAMRNGSHGDFYTTGFSKDTSIASRNHLPEFLRQFVDKESGWTSLPVDLYWYMTCRAITLKDYRAWPQVVANGRNSGIWILKYSHVSDSGKSVISFWHGTAQNIVVNSYAVPVNGATAVLITPTVGVKPGNKTALNVNNGTAWVTVTECPQYIEVTT